MPVVRGHFDMEGLSRTVCKEHISLLNMITVLSRLHLAIYWMLTFSSLKKRASDSSHVVVKIVDIVHV